MIDFFWLDLSINYWQRRPPTNPPNLRLVCLGRGWGEATAAWGGLGRRDSCLGRAGEEGQGETGEGEGLERVGGVILVRVWGWTVPAELQVSSHNGWIKVRGETWQQECLPSASPKLWSQVQTGRRPWGWRAGGEQSPRRGEPPGLLQYSPCNL